MSAAPVAVVTGAAGHIGTALTVRLQAAGLRVIAVDHPDVLDDGPDRWPLDLTDPELARQLAGRADALPHVAVLVHAAGITALGTLADTDEVTFRRVVDVNLHGAATVTRSLLPALRRAGGHVVAVSSVAGLLPVTDRPAYVASKHALTGLFRALRRELADDGVAVTVVHPTFLATAVGDGAGSARTTTGRPLTSDDVARTIVGLLVRRRRSGRAPDRVLVGRTAVVADLLHRLAPTFAADRAAAALRR